jgi:hypothetical protein
MNINEVIIKINEVIGDVDYYDETSMTANRDKSRDVEFYDGDYEEIQNIEPFVQKIANYLNANIIELDVYNRLILKRNDVYIGIKYYYDRDHDLKLYVAVSKDIQRV